jgi:hypothetical protein
VKATDNEPLDGVIAVIVGAEGVVDGITAAETVDVAPVPAALVALTRNVYDVPFVKPVTVADADVEVPSANVVHDPPDGKNSTT